MVANEIDVAAIVPAAGQSVRMGSGVSKALLHLGEMPVLRRTLDALLQSRVISRIVIPAREVDIEAIESMLAPGEPISVVLGGEVRQQSVLRGVEFLERFAPRFVVVHDAARCLVSAELVRRAVQAAREFGAVTVAVKIVDTVISVGADSVVEATVDRAKLWAVQTPQVFRFELLRDAHRAAGGDATDDASLVQRLCDVHIIEGERTNIKLTTPEDCRVAERLIDT